MENKTTTKENSAIDKAMEEIRRINCKNVGDFNPSCFMIQLENGSLYLEVKYRIAWFRIAFPNGVIETKIVRVDNDGVLFKATIYKEPGVVLANGYGHEWLNSKFDPFACAETRAIGRALAQAGFGTVFCGNELDEGTDPCDTGVKPKATPDNPKSTPSKPTIKLEQQRQPANAEQSNGVHSQQQEKTVEDYVRELNQSTAMNVICATKSAPGKQLGEMLKDKQGIELIIRGATGSWTPVKEEVKRYKAACIVLLPVAEKLLQKLENAA